MTWNFNINEAPKNNQIITASKCGKVIVSKWLEKEQRWNMYTKDSPPIAWWGIYPSHPTMTKPDVDLEDMF